MFLCSTYAISIPTTRLHAHLVQHGERLRERVAHDVEHVARERGEHLVRARLGLAVLAGGDAGRLGDSVVAFSVDVLLVVVRLERDVLARLARLGARVARRVERAQQPPLVLEPREHLNRERGRRVVVRPKVAEPAVEEEAARLPPRS